MTDEYGGVKVVRNNSGEMIYASFGGEKRYRLARESEILVAGEGAGLHERNLDIILNCLIAAL